MKARQAFGSRCGKTCPKVEEHKGAASSWWQVICGSLSLSLQCSFLLLGDFSWFFKAKQCLTNLGNYSPISRVGIMSVTRRLTNCGNQ